MRVFLIHTTIPHIANRKLIQALSKHLKVRKNVSIILPKPEEVAREDKDGCMVFRAVSAKRLFPNVQPGLELARARNAPRELIVRNVAYQAARAALKSIHPAIKGLKEGAGAKGVSRRQYPVIVELKIAGRSDDEIAKRLKVSVEVLKPHIQRAMEEYERGELVIDGGGAVSEARANGAEDAEALTVSLVA